MIKFFENIAMKIEYETERKPNVFLESIKESCLLNIESLHKLEAAIRHSGTLL